MKARTIKIPGMSTPRWMIWLHGAIQGHITKTAGIDEETGYISSGYVTAKCKLFNELSSNRVKQLEQSLKAVRTESFELMAENAHINTCLEELEGKGTSNPDSSISEKREAESTTSKKAAYQKRHKEIVERLGQIQDKIRSGELIAREELDATSSKLQSIFATYAHGVLFRPVQPKLIPPVEYNRCFELYRESHEDEDQQIRHILKEVFNYE